MLKLTAILAASNNGMIGRENGLPWGKLPRDMAHFAKITKEIGAVLMGRKTAESLGKPLPDRVNYVLARNADKVPEGFKHVPSLHAILGLPEQHIAVIGGGLVYAQLAPHCTDAWFTRVHADFSGDTALPSSAFVNFVPDLIEEFPADEANAYDLTFIHATNQRVLHVVTP